MKSSYFLAIAFLLFFTGVIAQDFSKEIWHNGQVVTTDQDSVKGLVKYDMEANVVQVIRNNVVKTYSSHNIFYVEIFDKVVQNYRQFYSIPYDINNNNYEIPIIFEVLYEGPLSLLSREAVVQETYSNNNNPYWAGSTYVRDRIAYTFFFLDKSGNIDRYTGKRNDLFMIMGRKSKQVKEFIKKNRLRTDDVRDLIRITAFYNSI